MTHDQPLESELHGQSIPRNISRPRPPRRQAPSFGKPRPRWAELFPPSATPPVWSRHFRLPCHRREDDPAGAGLAAHQVHPLFGPAGGDDLRQEAIRLPKAYC